MKKKALIALVVGLMIVFACGGGGEGSPTGFFGKSMTQLTTVGGHTPEWSPDGNSIVYTFQDDLWLIAPEEGSTPTQLTSMNGRELQPSWHPDPGARKIVFLNTADFSTYTIYSLEVDSSDDPVEIFTIAKLIAYPTYTSDGNQIAYAGLSKGDGILLIPASGEDEPQQIPNSDSWEYLQSAACSPLESKVVYTEIRGGDYNLFTIPLEGGTPTKLTSYTNTGGDINQVWFANWSRDGSKVVYSHGTSQYTRIYSIWIISASGGTPEQLSEDPEGARSETAQSVNFKHPSFSPDGLKLVAEHHDQIWVLEL